MPISFSSKNNYIAVVTPNTWSDATATSTDPTIRLGNIGVFKVDEKIFWASFYGYGDYDTCYSISWFAIGY